MWWVLSSAWAASSDVTTTAFEQALNAQRNRGLGVPTLQCPENPVVVSLSHPMHDQHIDATYALAGNDEPIFHPNPIIPNNGGRISGRILHHQTTGRDPYFMWTTNKSNPCIGHGI